MIQKRIIQWIFCLGLFLVSNQNIYANSEEIKKCCSSQKSDDNNDNCCSDKEQHTKSHEDGKHCTQDCCKNCSTCHAYPVYAIDKSSSEILDPIIFDNNYQKNFKYKSPYFKNVLAEIWQPPKI